MKKLKALLRNDLGFILASFAVVAIAAVILGLLTSCRSVRYVSVPEYHQTVVHQRDTVTRIDSVVIHDSVAVNESRRGDTILLTTVKWRPQYRDRWRDRLRTDTFIQRDTVTVVKLAEKPPNRTKSKTPIYFIALFASGLLLALSILIKKK